MFDSVAAVERADPAVLAAALFTLSEADIGAMSLEQAEALALGTQRVVSAAAARQRSAMETVARRCDEQCERDVADDVAAGMPHRHVSGDQVAASSLATLLHVSARTMATRVDHARRVVCALPEVQVLEWSGDLEPYRVDAVVKESYAAPSARLHEFEARVLEEDVRHVSCAALRRRARRAAERCAPQQTVEAFERAAARRQVRVQAGECAGMSRLVADLPTATAQRLWSAVDGLAAEYARAQPGLRVGAARADALVDLVEGSATVSTTVEVVAPVDCDARGSVAPRASTACLGPGESGADLYGDYDADRLGIYYDLGGCEELDDDILHDHDGRLWFVSSHTEVPLLGSLLPTDVVALLSDPDVTIRLSRSDSLTGAIRWQDPTTYRPGAATARAVRSRDGTCRFPGCATPARRCQLDHVVRHPDGPTTVTNLQTLCATHHGFKHHAGWSVEMDQLGICTWTAPDGRTHVTWPLDRHGFRAA